MPTDAWINAAARTDRRPVLLMAVESIEAKKEAITNQTHWEASTEKTASINTSAINGSCSIRTTYQNPVQTDGSNQGWFDTPSDEWCGPLPSFSARLASIRVAAAFSTTVPLEVNQAVTFDLYEDGVFVAASGGFLSEIVYRAGAGGVGIAYNEAHVIVDNPDPDHVFSAGSKISARNFLVPAISAAGAEPIIYEFTAVALTGSLRTISIDLGVTPTIPSEFGKRDIEVGGGAITYTAFGSDDNATWASLGEVEGGDPLAPYRYYQFGVAFASSGPESAILEEITVSGGDDQYIYFSTHENVPVKGAKPFLKNTLGTLSSKLELMRLGATGEVSPKLFYLRETFNMLKDNQLRNKAVTLKLGFLGLPEVDYEPLFAGLWHDATIDWAPGEISVKTRTIISRFQKAQIPAETSTGGPRNATNVIPREWVNTNIITVMREVIEYLGIPDRWIDEASGNLLSGTGGVRSSDNWLVSRRLDKDNKEEALKLLEELSVLSGVFLVQDPNGKLRFKLYDPTEAIVAEFTDQICTFSPVEMGQGELYTRQQIFYEPRHENDLDTGNERGPWADGSDYARNDSVTLTGVTWYCLQSHKSASSNTPGTGAAHRAYWTRDWAVGDAHVVGDVRISHGPLYTCKLAHTAASDNEPGRGLDWRSYWITQPSKAGNSDSDYHNAYVYINSAAELAWGLNEDPEPLKNPGYQKKWYDKWGATLHALTVLAVRMDEWFANPKMKLKAADLHPKFYRVRVGDMVGVTGLQLPVTGAAWGVPCEQKKFLVMSKSFDPAKCTVSFDLLEV